MSSQLKKKKKFDLGTEEESCHLKSMILSWGNFISQGNLGMSRDIPVVTILDMSFTIVS